MEALALSEAARWAESSSRRVRLGITIEPDGELTVAARIHLSSLDVVGGPVAVRVDLAAIATAENPVPPLPSGAAKPADRSWWDAAQRVAKRAGGHQALIVDADGDIIDGGTATVWIAEGGRVITPPSPPAVGGVARAFVMEAAARQGVEHAVQCVSWQRFEAAEEAFLTNAFGGPVEIRGRGGQHFELVRGFFDRLWGVGVRG